MKSVLTSAIQDVVLDPEMSMEELAFEDNAAQEELILALEKFHEAEARFDDVSQSLESISQIWKEFEATNTISTESMAQITFSMESYNIDNEFSMESVDELSLEKISGIWNRIKQVYVNAWHGLVDAFTGLITGWNKRMKKHRKINKELVSEWNNKKRDLLGDKHKSNMAGESIWHAFVVDNQLTRKPVDTMKSDVQHAEYMLSQYPKDISSYLMDFKTIVERGDYSDDASFERSVLKKITDLGHPGDVFKSDLIGYEGHPLMMNRGLEVVNGKSVPAAGDGKEYDKLSDMANGRHVKEYIFSWDELAQAHIFHDIYFTTGEVDDMLKLRERYIDLVTNLSEGRIFPVDKMAKDILKMRPKVDKGEDLSDQNVEAIEQINKILKNFKNYLMRPMRMEVTRVISIVTSSRTLISRTIATAETE